MKNYSISLYFRAGHTPPVPESEVLWEERILLVRASSTSEAERIALQYGKAEEHDYKTDSHGSVKWGFVRIERVVEIDGDLSLAVVTVFTRYLKNGEATSILQPLE